MLTCLLRKFAHLYHCTSRSRDTICIHVSWHSRHSFASRCSKGHSKQTTYRALEHVVNSCSECHVSVNIASMPNFLLSVSTAVVGTHWQCTVYCIFKCIDDLVILITAISDDNLEGVVKYVLESFLNPQPQREILLLNCTTISFFVVFKLFWWKRPSMLGILDMVKEGPSIV